MPGQVKRKEVYESDFWGNLRESTTLTIPEIRKLNEELSESARVLTKDLNKALLNNTKNIRKFLELAKKANKMKRDGIALDKLETNAIKQKAQIEIEAQKVKRAKLQTEREELRNSALLAKQKELQAKAEKRVAKVAAEESNAYQILSRRTREQKNESKQLAAQMVLLAESGKRLSPEYRKLANRFRQVTKEANKGDKTLKAIDATVGDNFRNVGNYTKRLDGLKTGLLRIAGALGVFQALRGITGIVVDFDQAQGDLLAISGKTEEQLSVLTAQAKELGAVTQFSATQITEMQIELAKLGFETGDIQKSTKAISNFAAATGAAIPEAAKLAGSALRGFGLDASEMDRVVSTLGVATTKTALDFNALSSGLATVAPVAKAFGFSIEDTTALLGQLSNAGFDASSAATATRNILLNLADANGDLAKELGRPIKNSEDLAGALKELSDRGIDLGQALELTDKRSVAAFQTFLDGADTLVDLRDSITDVNDELEAMAEKRLDTIGGQFTLLASAWEGFILSVNEGSGAGETIKNLIGGLADNLGSVVRVLGIAIKLFLAYKATLIALDLRHKLFNTASGKMAFNLKNVTKNLKASSKAGKGFGTSLKSIGFAIAITAAFELASAFWAIVSGATAAERQINKIKAANESASTSANKFLDKLSKAQTDRLSELERERALNKITQAEFLQGKKDAIAATKRELESAISSVDKRRTANIKLFFEAKKQLKDLRSQSVEFAGVDLQESGAELARSLGVEFLLPESKKKLLEAIDQFDKFKAKVEAGEEKIKLYNDALEEQSEDLKNVVTDNKAHGNSLKKIGERVKDNNTDFGNQIDLLKELNSELEEQFTIRQSIEDLGRSREIQDIQNQIDAELELQKTQAITEGGFDFTEIQRLTEERKRIEIEGVIDRRNEEIAVQRTSFKIRFADLKNELEEEREELLSQDNLTNTERAKIEANFQIELAKIKGLQLDAQRTLNLRIIQEKESANNEILDIEKNTADELKDINEDLVNDVVQFSNDAQDKVAADLKKKNDAIIKAEKEAAKRRMDIAKALRDFLDKQSDKVISQAEKEIAARENAIDRIERLTESGKVTAEQSIKAEERRIQELEKIKRAEERAKQRRQMISTAHDLYQAHVQAGDASPLSETIKDVALFQAFLSTIPAFDKGIENTGSNGAGIDGKGGFIATMHPYERVMDADNNAKVPSWMSNSYLANLAQDHDRGTAMRKTEGATQIGSGWETAAMIGKMDEMVQAYKDHPDFSSDFETMADGIAYLSTKRTKGNHTIHNRRRL